jgi:hypothetical protein
MINICGLWKHEGKNGTFYSGSLGGVDVLIFANKNRKSDKAPDLNLCISEKNKDYKKSSPVQTTDDNPWK